MTHTYHQTTGEWFHNSTKLGSGYSGAAKGQNNHDMEAVQAVGPIPVGTWLIGSPHDNPHTGPFTMDLNPVAGDETFGRTLFRIHGDNTTHNASHGCIILARTIREAIWASGDHTLQVVA